MPIIIRKSELSEIDPSIIEGRTWAYYQCPDGCDDFKSDIPFKTLYCIQCGKVMYRNAGFSVDFW